MKIKYRDLSIYKLCQIADFWVYNSVDPIDFLVSWIVVSNLLWNAQSTYIPTLLYVGNNLRRHHLHHYRHQTQDHPLRHNFQHIDGWYV